MSCKQNDEYFERERELMEDYKDALEASNQALDELQQAQEWFASRKKNLEENKSRYYKFINREI